MNWRNTLLQKDDPYPKTRIDKLQAMLTALSLDGCLIEHPVDLTYLTGLNLSAGALVVMQEECALFVDGRYEEYAKAYSSHPVLPWGDSSMASFIKSKKGKTVAFDQKRTSYERFLQLETLSQKAGCKFLAHHSFSQDLRMCKDLKEFSLLRQSAHLNWQGYQHIVSLLQEGVSEEELAWEYELFCRTHGAEKLAFSPIIAFGKNSALPHHRSSKTRLKQGDVVLIDIGVVVGQYCSDMTRTQFFSDVDPTIKELYNIAEEAQKAALALCRPGVKIGMLDIAAREVMKRYGVEELFLHSLGHGVGLEIHEAPRIKKDGIDAGTLLVEGMCITIEPGLYLSGRGGVRYEDTIFITKEGYENLYPENR